MTTKKTRITELLGIKYPIFQGGMAWIAESTLASAVSNAGGLGIIAGGSAPIDYLREQIRRCKSLTDKPFGVNIMLMSPYADEVAQMVAEEKVAVVTTGAGNPSRFPNVVTSLPEVVRKVDERWVEYGLGERLESPSDRYRALLLSDKAAW